MTPEQMSAICASFTKARTTGHDFGARFYHRLTTDYPESARLFADGNMEQQHARFVGQLEVILMRMNEGQPVRPLLQGLGNLHHTFGVEEEDFRNFGKTLMKVLQELLGDEFDDNLREAWKEVYESIARVMMSAIDEAG